MMGMFRHRKDPPAMTLEGVLGPNSRLDEADAMPVDAPDALCVAVDGRLLFGSGATVLTLAAWGAEPLPFATFDAPVTALCAGPSGEVAVGLEGGRLVVFDASGQPLDGWRLPAGRAASVVDCVFRGYELLVVDSGHSIRAELLARATWDETPRGQLLAIPRSGEMRVVKGALHTPMGVCLDEAGIAQVSLLERASVVDERGAVRRASLPGYLGRLRRTPAGYLVTCLARRDPLIEFLKTERGFVETMKATIGVEHWIAPRITPDFSHEFPIELGATRLFGEVKPWAPSFSYGLLIEADDQLMPIGSMQSRANGRRHAISDAALWNGAMVAVSRGSGEILHLANGGALS